MPAADHPCAIIYRQHTGFITIYHVSTHALMHDIKCGGDAGCTYECLACGEQVDATSNPMDCPSCDSEGAFQQLGNSLE